MQHGLAEFLLTVELAAAVKVLVILVKPVAAEAEAAVC